MTKARADNVIVILLSLKLRISHKGHENTFAIMSCCFIGNDTNDTNIQIILNYSAMIPYEFCFFGRKTILPPKNHLAISLIFKPSVATCNTFQNSLTLSAYSYHYQSYSVLSGRRQVRLIANSHKTRTFSVR